MNYLNFVAIDYGYPMKFFPEEQELLDSADYDWLKCLIKLEYNDLPSVVYVHETLRIYDRAKLDPNERLRKLFKTYEHFRIASNIIRLWRNRLVHMDPKELSDEHKADLKCIPEGLMDFKEQ